MLGKFTMENSWKLVMGSNLHGISAWIFENSDPKSNVWWFESISNLVRIGILAISWTFVIQMLITFSSQKNFNDACLEKRKISFDTNSIVIYECPRFNKKRVFFNVSMEFFYLKFHFLQLQFIIEFFILKFLKY